MADEQTTESIRAEGARGGRRAADPDRLLPGEDPQTRVLDDAEHWVDVYRELVAFKAQVLGITRRYAADARPEVAEEVSASDLRLLTAEHARLQRRLDYWEERRARLAGG